MIDANVVQERRIVVSTWISIVELPDRIGGRVCREVGEIRPLLPSYLVDSPTIMSKMELPQRNTWYHQDVVSM